MRTVLSLALVILFLVPVGIPLLFIEWIIGKFNPSLKDRSSLAAVQFILRGVQWFSGIQLTVIGRENIPDDRPVLYVSNHRSYFDIIIGYCEVKGLCGFVAKKEFRKIPLLSHWMVRLHCLFLDRENMREGMKTILAAIDLIKNGVSIWICPEGTRNHSEELLPFKEGSFKIAEKAGCPIIPVAFTHTDEVLENHFPWIHPHAVTLEFGAPIETATLDRATKRELPARTQQAVEEMYRKNL
ncbi:MAG: 1-acyl-sn-glycerol-3-phosphate acyltransferase [Lachnospiraceae bacterium]|nr:1-acyl-sn-glycerol-3-phosphate acyltransferase [Lachnospiraceae bacterium]